MSNVDVFACLSTSSAVRDGTRKRAGYPTTSRSTYTTATLSFHFSRHVEPVPVIHGCLSAWVLGCWGPGKVGGAYDSNFLPVSHVRW
jgi:hypothetical protein